MLTFSALRKFNIARCTTGFKQELSDWNIAEWGNATAGEGGEALEAMLLAMTAMANLGKVCNTAKKVLRFRDNIAGNSKSKDEYLNDLAREIAGTVIYLDLWAASVGVNLEDAIIEEFNAKSVQIGSPVVIHPEALDLSLLSRGTSRG